MGDSEESPFEYAWRIYGGTWRIDWGDGQVTTGRKEPTRPKLRVIEGGKS